MDHAAFDDEDQPAVGDTIPSPVATSITTATAPAPADASLSGQRDEQDAEGTVRRPYAAFDAPNPGFPVGVEGMRQAIATALFNSQLTLATTKQALAKTRANIDRSRRILETSQRQYSAEEPGEQRELRDLRATLATTQAALEHLQLLAETTRTTLAQAQEDKDAARAFAQRLDALLATASHDLRAPLAGLMGLLQEAQQQAEQVRDALSAPATSPTHRAPPPDQEQPPEQPAEEERGQGGAGGVATPATGEATSLAAESDPPADPPADPPGTALAARAGATAGAAELTTPAPTSLSPRLDEVVSQLYLAQASVMQVAQLVERLFDISQARTGTVTLDLAPCDLTALVRHQVATQQAATPERRLLVETPTTPTWVLADAVRLGQALTNYLTNALKYSAADRPIIVRLEVTEGLAMAEGLAVVSVEDHGPGLSWEEQQRVWEPFYRAPEVEAQSTPFGGRRASRVSSFGLGLSICKQLVELHPGGQVGVESVLGVGSIFWFRLPLLPTTLLPAQVDAGDAS